MGAAAGSWARRYRAAHERLTPRAGRWAGPPRHSPADGIELISITSVVNEFTMANGRVLSVWDGKCNNEENGRNIVMRHVRCSTVLNERPCPSSSIQAPHSLIPDPAPRRSLVPHGTARPTTRELFFASPSPVLHMRSIERADDSIDVPRCKDLPAFVELHLVGHARTRCKRFLRVPVL